MQPEKKSRYFNKFFQKFILIILFLIVTYSIRAQQAGDDSIFYQEAVTNLINLYNKEYREDIRLFNGTEYRPSLQATTGSPFWGSDTLTVGIIDYDGNSYNAIPMEYDILNQNLVIKSYDKNSYIALLNEKIKYFNIKNHLFFRIDAAKNNSSGITSGFYEQLYKGNVLIWAKHDKELKLSAIAEDQTSKYIQLDKYYIQQKDNYYLVDNMKTILKVFNDKESEVNKFIKANKLKFSTDPENTLIKVAVYYDSIKK